jgi:tetratricopeptide (TPR) repeat protein
MKPTPVRVLALVAALLATVPAVSGISAYEPKLADAIAQNDKAAVERASATLAAAHSKTPTLETKNDLAASRVFLGQYDEAIELLREAETSAPGKSAKVAANLGAALERKGGADEDALYWVRESSKRDANEHEGSGWLHVRILEAKIALARDPKWLEKHTLLGYDFGAEEEPVAPGILPVDKDGRLKGVDDLLADISLQIEERQKFASPPDAIIGDLAAAAGDLVYAGTDGNPAKHYELALRYGAPRASLVEKRLARFHKLYPHVQAEEDGATQAAQIAAARTAAVKEVTERRETRKMMWWIGGGVLTVLLILGAGWLFDRLRPKPARPPLPDIDYDSIGKS